MTDRFTPEVRSKIMSGIKGKNTSPERIVFSYLRREGVYFQKHYKRALGSPDIALPRKKRAVFIDGEFWHGYTLERRKDNLPDYWVQKIIRNVKRDRRYRSQLKQEGWQIMRVWESQLSKKNREATLREIQVFLLDTEN